MLRYSNNNIHKDNQPTVDIQKTSFRMNKKNYIFLAEFSIFNRLKQVAYSQLLSSDLDTTQMISIALQNLHVQSL